MKKLSKNKFIATLLIMLMIMPFFTNNYVLAEKQQNYDIEEVKVIIMENLRSSGLTEDEISFILERNPITEESVNNGLLTNEYDDYPSLFVAPGSQKVVPVKITKAFVESLGYGIVVGGTVAGWGLSKAAWTDIIVSAIGWKAFIVAGIAIGAAAGCMKHYLYGYDGVRLHVTWTWIYGDQSMEYFWGVTGITSERY